MININKNFLKSRTGIVAISLILTIVFGAADIVTTSQYRLFFFYVIPIIMSSLYVGVSYGMFLSCFSAFFMLTTSYMDHGHLHASHVWNAGMMLVVFFTIAYLTSILGRMKNLESEKAFVEEKNVLLDASLREKEMLIREIHHRMKNQLAMLGSLINLSSGDDTRNVIAKLAGRIQTFGVLYERLTYSEDNNSKINLKRYIEEIVSLIFQNFDVSRDLTTCEVSGDDIDARAKPASLIGLIINELVTNSVRHAFGGMADTMKRIDIDITVRGRALVLAYSDNGPGFDYHAARSSGGHIGFLLVDSIVRQLGGVTQYDASRGSEFTVLFSDAGRIIDGV